MLPAVGSVFPLRLSLGVNTAGSSFLFSSSLPSATYPYCCINLSLATFCSLVICFCAVRSDTFSSCSFSALIRLSSSRALASWISLDFFSSASFCWFSWTCFQSFNRWLIKFSVSLSYLEISLLCLLGGGRQRGPDLQLLLTGIQISPLASPPPPWTRLGQCR